MELAKRSRGTPRIANRLFKRVSDFALVEGKGKVDQEITKLALKRLKVDDIGLDNVDHQLLLGIIKQFGGGPVGVESIASVIGEEVLLSKMYMNHTYTKGFLKRTPRGSNYRIGLRTNGMNYQEDLFSSIDKD